MRTASGMIRYAGGACTAARGIVHQTRLAVVFRGAAAVLTACSDPGAPGPLGQPVLIEVIGGDGAVAVSGTQLDTIVVTLRDRLQRVVGNTPVTWTVTAGHGSVLPLDARTDVYGRVRGLWTLGPDPAFNTLTITAGNRTRMLQAQASTPFQVTSVAAGSAHTCALDAGGNAYCWGSNSHLQLGIGASDPRLYRTHPVRVAGNSSFSMITSGPSHSCGLDLAGEAWCWGDNAFGQLGDNTLTPRPGPSRVLTSVAFTTLAAGGSHTCGLSYGNVYCWGDNGMGQVGAPRTQNGLPRPMPVAPPFRGARFTALFVGLAFSCAVESAGDVYCWGSNRVRELGTDVTSTCVPSPWDYAADGARYPEEPTPCIDLPLRVPIPRALASVTAGKFGACGVAPDSAIWCWGYALPAPQVVPGARARTSWVVGDDVCGVQDDDSVQCWSLREAARFAPTQPFGNAVALADLTTGYGTHFCGLTRDQHGVAHCWGTNSAGQLGDGTQYTRALPVPVVTPPQ